MSYLGSCGYQLQVASLHTLFQEGEQALLLESRRRRLIKLDSNKYTDTSLGRVNHADIIGKEVGCQPHTVLGGRVMVRRPSLEEYTLLMHRGATPSYCSVVYAAVCMLDVGSMSRVVEAGTGSGAMTLHLSRIGTKIRTYYVYVARSKSVSWGQTENKANIVCGFHTCHVYLAKNL